MRAQMRYVPKIASGSSVASRPLAVGWPVRPLGFRKKQQVSDFEFGQI